MVITVPKEKKIQELTGNVEIQDTRKSSETEKSSEQLEKSQSTSKRESVEKMQKAQEEKIEVQNNKKSSDTNTASEQLINSQSSSRRASVDKIQKTKEENKYEGHVPMTMRDPFFLDPFFNSTLGDIESSSQDFFKTARENFENSMKSLELKRGDATNSMGNDLKMENTRDSNMIRFVDNEDKLEMSLDTVGYKPDELKVTVG